MLDTLLKFRRIGLFLESHTVKLPHQCQDHIEYWLNKYTQMAFGVNYITLDYRTDWL